MKLRTLLPMLLAGAAIGVLIFLLRETQTVDNELHLERLARIRTVDGLDVQLNRAITQARVSSLAAVSDQRPVTTRKLGKELDLLDKGSRSLRGLAPELDHALDTFLDTIDNKLELGFDFEARNTLLSQRMISSMDAVPTLADAVVAAARPAERDRIKELTAQLKSEIVTFGTVEIPTNAQNIRTLLDELDTIAKTQSAAFREAVFYLRTSADGVLADKTELVEQLGGYLGRPIGPQLQAVEQAYMNWHGTQVAIANQYRLLLAGYAAALLLGLAWLGLRLRRSYRELDQAHDQLVAANQNLEGQVQARTKDLRHTLQELRSSQAQLVQSEKMASLGQMVAGVAHEINTPLGYARSNAEIVRTSLGDMRELVSAQNKALGLMTSEHATDEEVAQALAEAEAKRESLNAEELVGDLDTLLSETDYGLMQISELVGSLKDFSRVDRSRTDLFNVNDGIDSALKILQNQLKHRIEVVKSYGQLRQIECAPSQLNQVFLNVLNNAAQAIEAKGKILVHTSAEPQGVAIRILDTGCGMTDEVRARIFEPFFTTKPVGSGTGLGLSIVYRIIEDHGGRIEVRSTPGKGSEFTIHLPFKQKRQAEIVPQQKPPQKPALAVA